MISRGVHGSLDELRGSRHRERDGYVRGLDPRRVLETARGVTPALEATTREVARFRKILDQTAPDPRA